MSLTIDEVTALSRRVASEVDANLQVVTVVSSDREAGRIELLITIDGCHREPCSLMVNLPRGERGAVEQELRRQLMDALRQHASDDA